MQAYVLALGVLVAANAGYARCVAQLPLGQAVDEVRDLEARIERVPDKAAVRVLVLGNSHAMAGLRPAQLAAAWGLAADQVFSLALPGGSAGDAARMLARYGPRFPQARTVWCNVNAYFLSADAELRSRYLTRDDWFARLRYAGSQPHYEARIGLALAWWFPLADFSFALKKQPLQTARVLLGRPVAEPERERLAAIAYPWGLPLPWDHPSLLGQSLASYREEARPIAYVHRRIGLLFDQQRDPLRGLEALRELAGLARQRGMMLKLVRIPYAPRLQAALPPAIARRDEGFWQALGVLAREEALPLVVPQARWADAEFYDCDHLAPAGASKLASALEAPVSRR